MMAADAEDIAAREITVSRKLKAPRPLVYRMMAEAAHVAQWWGPNGFTTTITKMDFRVGGEWVLTMHGPDGTDYPNYSVFTEIVANERICYDHSGGKPGTPDKRFTWTFEDAGPNATIITMRLTFDTVEARDATLKHGVLDGANQTLARLDVYLSKH
jgi:uncharacterized protein YndB with AHSA1/START domain